ncbi:MAG: hypothetical protein D6767_01270, partial [Candidatus Hydrogenedentota bacterium]
MKIAFFYVSVILLVAPASYTQSLNSGKTTEEQVGSNSEDNTNRLPTEKEENKTLSSEDPQNAVEETSIEVEEKQKDQPATETTQKNQNQEKRVAKQEKAKESREHQENQFLYAPEDPSFLYETRFIPDIKINDGFLSPQMEKALIVENIDKQKEASKLKIKLPNLMQTIV